MFTCESALGTAATPLDGATRGSFLKQIYRPVDYAVRAIRYSTLGLFKIAPYVEYNLTVRREACRGDGCGPAAASTSGKD